jgi:hypothetical protein
MPNYGVGYGAGTGSMWGWDDPMSMNAMMVLEGLAARVAALEAFKEEASMHLKNLKQRVDVLSPKPATEESKAGLIDKPPGLDIGEADTSASDSDAKALGGRQGDMSSSDEDNAMKEPEWVLKQILEDDGGENSDGADEPDDMPPPPPPPQLNCLSRQTSELISFAPQSDNSVQISWLFTNFRAKMVKQLGRASVSPSINNADLEDARILISPLGSVEKMPRSRKEKAAYTKTVEQGPFCPYLQLKVPSKQTMTFCFVLGDHSSEKQIHDFGSSPMSTLVKIESVDWLKHIHEGDLTLTLKIFA